ncbi:MAG: multidrug efflux SMR transporter [Wolbachia endosymbiont of Xenopsylla cheopis]
MNWLYLLIAGIIEIIWTLGIRYSDGFTRLWPTVGVMLTTPVSLYLLALAMRSIPLGTCYAVWTGIGSVGTAILGVVLFNEPSNLAHILCISLIIIGIIGLKLFTH